MRRDSSRRSSTASHASRTSHSRLSPHSPDKDKLTMLMEAFDRKNKAHHLMPGVYLDKSKLEDHVSDIKVKNGEKMIALLMIPLIIILYLDSAM